ncbi:MAG: sodium/proline symporter PutP [Schaalia hyovaginalis]|uniref:sodium/proline symporter PutP n=1 Tax=Schaalia TaxID=2529408 RepID=UPI0012B36774|nr:sodium/proline symporter PutP [Schaalia hyovaginalis]MCI6556633.1 sodium/proline symporter PutP [Schaalia hyovaginalis]MCI7513518.1 sodium/proline symporter PutP [Schaalia hyovaginalis]MDD7554272.1 sodium/proline symporter PutP [Schaalia hyovaginalis]MDY3093885.1 sodium/proline symporter PutP [Schaalia hyovaginalis]MDY6213112.1 sodium/proline symporter PutP [Schaalia hyovaginalis]
MSTTTFQAIAMIIYLVAMVMIGLFAYNRTKSLDDYMLGGRGLGPAVAALSAGAADMSGWLLMGLPGALYATGLLEGWIAVGLTVGAWLNWKFTAPRLRAYSQIAKDSITIPSFLGERLRDTSKTVRIVAGIVITVFFTFYVSSGMVAGGSFFESSFGMNYHLGMVIVAAVTVLYTLVGGFLAVSWTDVVQGLIMLIALVAVPIVGILHVGGLGPLIEQVNAIDPTILSFTHGDHALSGAAILGIVSALAWGLGYFGQPHIIVRFMALRSVAEAKQGRRIGIGWMVLSVIGAGLTAIVGVAVYQHDTGRLANPEGVFIALGQMLFHPLLAGFMLAAILAAIMSTISSQLLVTSSALVEDIYHAFTKRELSGADGVLAGRIAVGAVSVIAALLAWPRSDTILGLVAFAWAGFGASFGPIVILALYWRRLTAKGAIAGMITGAVVVGIWGNVSGGIFDLYEIVPGFLLNLLVTIAISSATHSPHAEIEAEMDQVVAQTKGI